MFVTTIIFYIFGVLNKEFGYFVSCGILILFMFRFYFLTTQLSKNVFNVFEYVYDLLNKNIYYEDNSEEHF